MEILFINPTEEELKTNILLNLAKNKNLKEIKVIITELEDINFDLSKDFVTFRGEKYGIVHWK